MNCKTNHSYKLHYTTPHHLPMEMGVSRAPRPNGIRSLGVMQHGSMRFNQQKQVKNHDFTAQYIGIIYGNHRDFTVNNGDSNIQKIMRKESLNQQQWDCDGDTDDQ